MTGRSNLEFPLKTRGRPRLKIARQVVWAAVPLSLGNLLDRLLKQGSCGQRQRVVVGWVLVKEPTAFLMNELLSSLGSRLWVQIRSELSELLDQLNATTLYVTHDQSEAITLGKTGWWWW